MKKTLKSEEEKMKFKNDFENFKMNTEVLLNIYMSNSDLNKNVEKHWEYWNKNDSLCVKLIIIRYIEKAMNANFGPCDFEFKGNKDYKNRVIEFEGLKFIVGNDDPRKIEVVIDNEITQEQINTMVKFEQKINEIVFDYIGSIKESLKKEEKEMFEKIGDLSVDYNKQVNLLEGSKAKSGMKIR